MTLHKLLTSGNKYRNLFLGHGSMQIRKSYPNFFDRYIYHDIKMLLVVKNMKSDGGIKAVEQTVSFILYKTKMVYHEYVIFHRIPDTNPPWNNILRNSSWRIFQCTITLFYPCCFPNTVKFSIEIIA